MRRRTAAVRSSCCRSELCGTGRVWVSPCFAFPGSQGVSAHPLRPCVFPLRAAAAQSSSWDTRRGKRPFRTVFRRRIGRASFLERGQSCTRALRPPGALPFQPPLPAGTDLLPAIPVLPFLEATRAGGGVCIAAPAAADRESLFPFLSSSISTSNFSGAVSAPMRVPFLHLSTGAESAPTWVPLLHLSGATLFSRLMQFPHLPGAVSNSSIMASVSASLRSFLNRSHARLHAWKILSAKR